MALDTQKMGGSIMKNIKNRKMIRPAAAFVVAALCISVFSAPALAQVFVRRPGPPPGFYAGFYVPPPPPRRANDLDRALAIVGTVGAVAAIANARNNRFYYRQPAVVVVPQRPVVVTRPPVVVERPVIVERPVVVERQVVVDRPVVVERQVPVVVGGGGTYSPKLGASFRIENMQIPGHRFTAARLTTDPAEGSPLNDIGLQRGDVITRLNDNPANTLAELERHTGHTTIRYIKTGTTRVLLANIYIPADTGVFNGGTYHAP